MKLKIKVHGVQIALTPCNFDTRVGAIGGFGGNRYRYLVSMSPQVDIMVSSVWAHDVHPSSRRLRA